jgi:PAS domain S-box-containing protein
LVPIGIGWWLSTGVGDAKDVAAAAESLGTQLLVIAVIAAIAAMASARWLAGKMGAPLAVAADNLRRIADTGDREEIDLTGEHEDLGEAIGAVLDTQEQRYAIAKHQVDSVAGLPTPVVTVDKEFNVTFINRAGADAVGVDAHQAIGQKCYKLFNTPHCQTGECRVGQAMRTGKVHRGETVVDPDRLGIPIEYTAAPVTDSQGNIVGGLEYVVDISDRKRVLKEILRVSKHLADKDLTAKSDADFEGDYLELARNLNGGIAAQHDAMVQVALAVEQVSSAAGQIAASSQTVAQGTSEQAASLEETSSSLEQMAGMTQQNADNTRQARGLAQATRTTAEGGDAAMKKMLGSMTETRSAAESTAQIISDINEIAFQTNLLALNAAVEAARAGDAGRGFAVVAEEVRNLALRSKDAARRTDELIRQSVELAQQGSEVSEDVSANLGEIVASVGKVTDIVTEIAAASDEQARGIEQVNKAVAEMDRAVQQTAASSEESSSAAEELASQSEQLQALVSQFRLNAGARPANQAPRPAQVHTQVRATPPARRGNGGHGSRPAELIPLDSQEGLADF